MTIKRALKRLRRGPKEIGFTLTHPESEARARAAKRLNCEQHELEMRKDATGHYWSKKDDD